MFSTNPDFKPLAFEDEGSLVGSSKQFLEAHIERKGRGGKVAVIIKGYKGNALELAQLAKDLKAHCGVGGTAKNDEIILQGEVRDKAMNFLKDLGHSVKRVGG